MKWFEAESLTDEALEVRPYGPCAHPGVERPEPELAVPHEELRGPM